MFGKKMRKNKTALLFIYSILSLVAANAQDDGPGARWYNHFFIEGAVHYYFSPASVIGELVETKPGFRAALGYELRHFRLAVESGYSHVIGTNPLVLDISLVPLVLKFGYELPLFSGFGVQADLSAGFIFSRTSRYETAIDMVMDNLLDDRALSILTGARLYAAYTLPCKFIKFYAGGGLDMIIETDGPIPIPLIEAGISLKPLFNIRPRAPKPAAVMPIAEEPVHENVSMLAETPQFPPEETEEIIAEENVTEEIFDEEITIEENIIEEIFAEEVFVEEAIVEEGFIEETVPEIIERTLSTVYFPPDETVPFPQYLSVLDAAGERLQTHPVLHITLRGYSAPLRTAGGQINVSRERAAYCRNYLIQKFGIDEERITIEYFGADRKPEMAVNTAWESFRCVELIIDIPEIDEPIKE